jgi:hypothetical protein
LIRQPALPSLKPLVVCETRQRKDNGTALVVFADQTGLKYLRWLRRGFRHCFVMVRVDGGWIVCDAMSHRTDLNVVGDFTADELTNFYRSIGFMVIRTRIRRAPLRLAPVRPYTCVEAVKRVLGLHAPWILTPWQLYKKLRGECACANNSLDRAGNLGI